MSLKFNYTEYFYKLIIMSKMITLLDALQCFQTIGCSRLLLIKMMVYFRLTFFEVDLAFYSLKLKHAIISFVPIIYPYIKHLIPSLTL